MSGREPLLSEIIEGLVASYAAWLRGADDPDGAVDEWGRPLTVELHDEGLAWQLVEHLGWSEQQLEDTSVYRRRLWVGFLMADRCHAASQVEAPAPDGDPRENARSAAEVLEEARRFVQAEAEEQQRLAEGVRR